MATQETQYFDIDLLLAELIYEQVLRKWQLNYNSWTGKDFDKILNRLVQVTAYSKEELQQELNRQLDILGQLYLTDTEQYNITINNIKQHEHLIQGIFYASPSTLIQN